MPDLRVYFQEIMAERGLTYKVGFTGRLRIGAALIFFAFGIIAAVQGALKLHPVTWPLGAIVIALLSLLFLYRRKPAAERI